MDSRYTELITEKISEEAVVNLFTKYGAREASRSNKHIWFNTFCHGGDSDKLCYNRDSKSFYCYTHCGYLSMFTLLSRVLHISYNHAVEILAEKAGFNYRRSVGDTEWVDKSWETQLIAYAQARGMKTVTEPFQFPIVDETILNYYSDNIYYSGWLNEGISAEVMSRFGIRWDESQLAIIIPHRDIDGNLIGIRQRPLSVSRGKYFPVTVQDRQYAHPLGMNLYGAYENKNALQSRKSAIIFEGEKSVMKHMTMYGDMSNAVACCGFHVSDVQRQILLNMGVQEVTLAFDKDCQMRGEAAQRYKRKIEAIAQLFTPFMRTYALVDFDDLLALKDAPVDCGREVFEKLVRTRCLIETNGIRMSRIKKRKAG